MIRVLVDSSSDYSIEEIQKKGLDLVPISIAIGERNYVDGFDMGRDEFYEILQSSSDFPKTSQPSPQTFLDIFEDVKAKGDELICILISSELSGTFQTAQMAKNMVDYDKIYLIDSRSATYTIKVMADYALQLRDEGKTSTEIVQKIEALKPRVKVLAALNTLEFLGRGGRISKTAAAIGDLANIKPIITVTVEGGIGILGKALGKNKAIMSIIRRIDELGVDGRFPAYTIYSYGDENCVAFEEKLHREGIHTANRLQIGSTIGTHIGPGAFGIVFVTAQ